MRLVLDTNTAVSGLIWGRVPGRLIDAAVAGKLQIISSLPLLEELQGVLLRKKFAARLAECYQYEPIPKRADDGVWDQGGVDRGQ